MGARPDEREEDGGTIPGSGTTPAPGGFSARRADTAPARVSNERSSLGSSASTRLPALDEHHVLDDVGMAVGRGPSWEGERRRSGVSGVGGPPSSASASYLVTSNLHPAYTEAVDRASQVGVWFCLLWLLWLLWLWLWLWWVEGWGEGCLGGAALELERSQAPCVDMYV